MIGSPVSLGIADDVIHIRDINSLEEYRNLLKRHYPDSAGEIDDVLTIIRKIMKNMDVLYGTENPIFKDLKRDISFVFRKIMPWFPRFLFTVRKINRMNGPVEVYMKGIVTDPSLRDMISQHFF